MVKLYTRDYIYRALKGNNREEINVVKIPAITSFLIRIIEYLICVSYFFIWVIAKIPLLNSILATVCVNFVRGNLGFLLRGLFFKTQLKKMGVNVFIDRGSSIIDPDHVEIGSNTYIDTNVDIYGGLAGQAIVKIGNYVHIAGGCIIGGRAGVEIGDYTGIAAGSRVYSATHHYKNIYNNEFVIISPLVPKEHQFLLEGQVIIKEHVFIGFNSIVLPGVVLEKGCVIGALSLVKSDVPEFVVAVGSPLKIINTRPRPLKQKIKNNSMTI